MTAVEKRLVVLVAVGILVQNLEKFIWPAKLCRGRLAVVVAVVVVVGEEWLGKATTTTLVLEGVKGEGGGEGGGGGERVSTSSVSSSAILSGPRDAPGRGVTAEEEEEVSRG